MVAAPVSCAILVYTKRHQDAHGIKRADYTQYQQFCANHQQTLKEAMLKDQSNPQPQFEIAIMQAEDLHARAMACCDANDNVQAASLLESAALVINELQAWSNQFAVDHTTQLELEAYLKWLQGSRAFLQDEWNTASTLLTEAKTIYELQLRHTASPEHQAIYDYRCDEITTLTKYALNKLHPLTFQ